MKLECQPCSQEAYCARSFAHQVLEVHEARKLCDYALSHLHLYGRDTRDTELSEVALHLPYHHKTV